MSDPSLNELPFEDLFCIHLSEINEFLRQRSPEARRISHLPSIVSGVSELLSLLPIWDETEGRPNRRLALELADLLSAEERQQLYRFSVLVTKLGV